MWFVQSYSVVSEKNTGFRILRDNFVFKAKPLRRSATACAAGHRNTVKYHIGTFDSFTAVTLFHVLNASSTSAMKGAKSLYAMDISPFRLSASPPFP